MAPALDVGGTIGALLVADRHVGDLEVQLGGAEQEVEVAEGIEVAEVGAIGGDLVVVYARQHLGPAKRVLESLA